MNITPIFFGVFTCFFVGKISKYPIFSDSYIFCYIPAVTGIISRIFVTTSV